jgi:hypothetical protein
MLPLVILVSFSLIVIMVSLLIPWGSATTERAQAQTAADAAALAALDIKRRAWVQETAPGTLGFLDLARPVGAVRGVGRVRAAGYADDNGAELVGYRVRRGSRVEVEVEKWTTSHPDTGRARAAATAEMAIDLDACAWDDPLPEPPVEAGGAPLFERTLSCGGWQARYEIANVPGAYPTVRYRGTDEKASFNRLRPRLVD